MSEPKILMNRRIRLSATILLVALAVEAASLLWGSPLAFFLFLICSGALAVLGIGLFLLSLVRRDVEGA